MKNKSLNIFALSVIATTMLYLLYYFIFKDILYIKQLLTITIVIQDIYILIKYNKIIKPLRLLIIIYFLIRIITLLLCKSALDFFIIIFNLIYISIVMINIIKNKIIKESLIFVTILFIILSIQTICIYLITILLWIALNFDYGIIFLIK